MGTGRNAARMGYDRGGEDQVDFFPALRLHGMVLGRSDSFDFTFRISEILCRTISVFGKGSKEHTLLVIWILFFVRCSKRQKHVI